MLLQIIWLLLFQIFRIVITQTCSKDNFDIEKGVPIHWDLIGMDQNDPKLIESIKSKVLWAPPPTSKKLNLDSPVTNANIRGQYGQPLSVEDVLKTHKLWGKKKKKGFFVEAGASSGEHISNSIYFELKHHWTGLLVEPNPDFLKTLKSKNRRVV